MKFNKRVTIAATILTVISGGGIALANPTMQQQIANITPNLPKDWQANINSYLDTYNTFTKISALLQGGQFSKIFGADAQKMLTSSGTFNAEKTMDKKGDNGKPVSDVIAKQYGLTEESAGQLVDTLNGVDAAKKEAVNADNNLKVSQQAAIIQAAHVKQLAANTEATRGLVNQNNITIDLLNSANVRAKGQSDDIAAMNEASTPWFSGGKK